jgi:hypothetical protein
MELHSILTHNSTAKIIEESALTENTQITNPSLSLKFPASGGIIVRNLSHNFSDNEIKEPGDNAAVEINVGKYIFCVNYLTIFFRKLFLRNRLYDKKSKYSFRNSQAWGYSTGENSFSSYNYRKQEYGNKR